MRAALSVADPKEWKVAQPHRMAMAPAMERGRVRSAWPSLPDSITQ